MASSLIVAHSGYSRLLGHTLPTVLHIDPNCGHNFGRTVRKPTFVFQCCSGACRLFTACWRLIIKGLSYYSESSTNDCDAKTRTAKSGYKFLEFITRRRVLHTRYYRIVANRNAPPIGIRWRQYSLMNTGGL